MIDSILAELKNLPPEFGKVERFNDPWYSVRSMTRAMGTKMSKKEIDKLPSHEVVRVHLPDGMLELHPNGESVKILCYCCFGGDPEKGVYPLTELRSAVLELKNHVCPPWPG